LPPFADCALSGRGGEAGAHQLCQLIRREAMHAHDGFGAASRAATSEKPKRAAKIGLSAAKFSKHQVPRRFVPFAV